MTSGYNEQKIHHANDALPLSVFVSVDEEFPSEIELLRYEFKQEKTTLTKEIAHLKKEKSQLEINIYLREG